MFSKSGKILNFGMRELINLGDLDKTKYFEIPGSLSVLDFSVLHGYSTRVQKYKPFIKLKQGHWALFEPVRGNMS